MWVKEITKKPNLLDQKFEALDKESAFITPGKNHHYDLYCVNIS
jgi:hypothetical protein